ncbi:DUF4142 domain-containing protein [Streptomyces orinoci]|uniref:DUF4142 domain-containing protein n=1 Tax=Streptomyces orinoci TaxID=67339 RepID=A0ABV3KB12_STRON|nr:DUF4142 domain-containing protein [Streptomyces orinoci]
MRSGIRTGAGTGLIAIALLATAAALLFPVWSYRDRTGTDPAAGLTARTAATRYGPLSAADRYFVIRLRQDGRWQLPAERRAGRQGGTAAVRRAGERLAEAGDALDRHTDRTADRLGLPLPDRPSAARRATLARLAGAHGAAFDHEFLTSLRRSQGELFTLTGRIRAATHNTAIRELSEDANQTLLDNLRTLDSTSTP